MRYILIFLLLAINLPAQTTDWVKSFGGAASDKGISIGTDSLGFIYISGYYNNEATFGGITLTNSPLSTGGNNKENFVAKLDSTGDVIWAIPGGNQGGS
ncbi:MAG: SBBP repeat-containing protein, partial [Flavobacteriales bacterium]|nr:SBBP repeat-containing protein [Flavobacteriales bacterium]